MTVKAAYPRQFVEADDSLSAWSQIKSYMADLTDRPVSSPQDLNQWLLDWSELAACIDEVGTDRYVSMTCQTDDAERKQAYLDFVENIEPKCKPKWHALHCKYVKSPRRKELPEQRFQVFDRAAANAVELYRDENVALQVDEAKLEQEYQEIMAAMTVTYDGEERTLQQLSPYLERTDRSTRQDVWELMSQRRLRDADALDTLFGKLFTLRHRMAVNAGLSDYRAYAFKAKERFDYTPEDCIAFHEAIEKTCVPLLRERQASRKERLGVDRLRPWDLAVDVKGRAPLRPFPSSGELIDKCATIFDRIDPELSAQFRAMADACDLDLDSRKGKAPGGYQSTYQESRRPFIFMNAVGLQRDVRTLLHECGHAFHAIACRDEPLVHYRSAPIEFAEVASMAMELLALDQLDVFYDGEDLDRAKRHQLDGIVSILPWVATIDAFQHWMYTNPDHTPAARTDEWLRLHERFGGSEDYTGYDETLARSWQRQLHLYQVPFYYIEYGIAQIGALQVWRNAKRNRGRALADYRGALALGGSRPLPELYAAAGIDFSFSAETIGPLIEDLQSELAKLAP